MNEKKMFNTLKKLVSKEQLTSLAEYLIITTTDGYELFGEYEITPIDGLFRVSHLSTHLNKNFYSLKNAVVWATLDKRKKIKESQRVVELDILLEGTYTSIDLHKLLCEKSKNIEAKTIYFSKLKDEQFKQSILNEEITSYIQETKRWQDQKFKQASK